MFNLHCHKRSEKPSGTKYFLSEAAGQLFFAAKHFIRANMHTENPSTIKYSRKLHTSKAHAYTQQLNDSKSTHSVEEHTLKTRSADRDCVSRSQRSLSDEQ